MTRHALILVDPDQREPREFRLRKILDFFGVVSTEVDSRDLKSARVDEDCVVFGATQQVARFLRALPSGDARLQPAAIYAYTNENRQASEDALRFLSGNQKLALADPPQESLAVKVTGDYPDVTGSMSGIEARTRLRGEDSLVSLKDENNATPLITAGEAALFVRFERSGMPIFFCASSYIVDLDRTIEPSFYDIKSDFCSAVSLVMFLRFAFPESIWKPQELGACLIVDDPLLRKRYGHCDFQKLNELMIERGFTTNIGFIPWNWRRTSPSASDFFKRESARYSISVHGCDHTHAEFGTTSAEVLNNKARLARSRMQNHEARTGIGFDPVMIFPQGVFSSLSPGALKRNGFRAAVNTETVPVDLPGARTKVRDVWDVAIMTYGSFAIFTRRYAFHGLENFAFDLLLGKPCLIVTHHDSFRDGGVELLNLIDKLHTLNCALKWRHLGDVILRACRRRTTPDGVIEVEMYGSELQIDNPADHDIKVRFCKRESHEDSVEQIFADGRPIAGNRMADALVFSETVPARSKKCVRVTYRDAANPELDRSLRTELSVALRRILSEFRDDYLARSPFMRTSATTVSKDRLAKVAS